MTRGRLLVGLLAVVGAGCFTPPTEALCRRHSELSIETPGYVAFGRGRLLRFGDGFVSDGFDRLLTLNPFQLGAAPPALTTVSDSVWFTGAHHALLLRANWGSLLGEQPAMAFDLFDARGVLRHQDFSLPPVVISPEAEMRRYVGGERCKVEDDGSADCFVADHDNLAYVLQQPLGLRQFVVRSTDSGVTAERLPPPPLGVGVFDSLEAGGTTWLLGATFVGEDPVRYVLQQRKGGRLEVVRELTGFWWCRFEVSARGVLVCVASDGTVSNVHLDDPSLTPHPVFNSGVAGTFLLGAPAEGMAVLDVLPTERNSTDTGHHDVRVYQGDALVYSAEVTGYLSSGLSAPGVFAVLSSSADGATLSLDEACLPAQGH